MSETTFTFDQEQAKASSPAGSFLYSNNGTVQFTSANAFTITASQINSPSQQVYTAAEVDLLMESRLRDLECKMLARMADLEYRNEQQAQRINALQSELNVVRVDADVAKQTAAREMWDPYSQLSTLINSKIDHKMFNEVHPLKDEVAKLKESTEKLAAINLQQYYSLSAKNTTGYTKAEFAQLTEKYDARSDKREMISNQPSIHTTASGWYVTPTDETKFPQ